MVLDALELLASAALAAGELERCQDALWELSRVADACGRPRSRWTASFLGAALMLAAGDPGADDAAHAAFTLGSELGIADALGAFGVHTLARQLLLGDLASLVPLTDLAIATYPNLPAWRAAAALAHAHGGDAERARGELERFVVARHTTASRHFDRPGLCLAAHAAAELGDPRAAEEVLGSFAPDQAVVVVGAGAAILGPLTMPVALAEFALGDTAAAARHLDAAADLAHQLGWQPWVQACQRWRTRIGSPAR